MQSGCIHNTIDKLCVLEGEYELIVVNNNSVESHPLITKYIRELSKSYPKTIKIVEPDANLGTSRGFNAGLKVSSSESRYFIYMSQDAEVVDPAMLSKMDKVMSCNPRLGIMHPTSVYEDANAYNFSSLYGIKAFHRMIRNIDNVRCADIPPSELFRIRSFIDNQEGVIAPLATFPLTFAVIRRDLVEKIGSFDDGAGLACHENNDFAYRALKSGFLVGRFRGIFINHRRYVFRNLTLPNNCDRYALPHVNNIQESTDWWMNKWGKPYIELYCRWRFGPILYMLIYPYLVLRRWLSIFLTIFPLK